MLFLALTVWLEIGLLFTLDEILSTTSALRGNIALMDKVNTGYPTMLQFIAVTWW